MTEEGKEFLKGMGQYSGRQCRNAIERVKENWEIEKSLQVIEMASGKFYIALKAKNHLRIAETCEFKSREECKMAIEECTEEIRNACIVDVSKVQHAYI